MGSMLPRGPVVQATVKFQILELELSLARAQPRLELELELELS